MEQAILWLIAMLGGFSPYPWQRRLLMWLIDGKPLPSHIGGPTAVGKTSLLSIALIARACGAPLPRRIVYVVDRRAIVDQATDEALNAQRVVDAHPELKRALGIPRDGQLAVSALRGGLKGNRDWLLDPSQPAIILATPDMIGSRLLFSGYGTSKRMRPYEAALLGADTLYIIDESHLLPPFELLLRSATHFPRPSPIPGIQVVSLSATGASNGKDVFNINAADLRYPALRKRLCAHKRIIIAEPVKPAQLVSTLTREAVQQSQQGTKPGRYLVFVNSRADAQQIAKELAARLKQSEVLLFTGARRGLEAEALKAKLFAYGFLGYDAEPVDRPFYVVATAAGEVGVDLDADHAVCDLVEWPRLVQRFGRVNRRGNGNADIIVVPVETDKKESPTVQPSLQLLQRLPCEPDGYDASPYALNELQNDPESQALLKAACTPPPYAPELTIAALETLAQTSLDTAANRIEVAPYIRGWVDDPPETTVLWRDLLPPWKDAEEYVDIAPPERAEELTTLTSTVVAWLKARAARTESGTGYILRYGEAPARYERYLDRDRQIAALSGATLMLSSDFGGLDLHGLLDAACDAPAESLDVKGMLSFRAHETESTESLRSGWREECRFTVEQNADGIPQRWLVISSPRSTLPSTEEARSTARDQLLDEHHQYAVKRLTGILNRLDLKAPLRRVPLLAEANHDTGKASIVWQRAFHAPPDGIYGKTSRAPNVHALGGYRHELGSLLALLKDTTLAKLSDEERDLCLHLVAAHHGWARPLIPTSGVQDCPPTSLERVQRDVALRFARLTQQWGPWGLAWLETLVRAADQMASRDLEKESESDGDESNPG